jgi:hypothetical protein
VIFAAFGDMMRVPGTQGSPLEHKARGMDVRIVYSPSDALKLAAAQSRKARHVFRHRFRNHRALHRADADARQGRRHPQLLCLLQSRHHHSGHPRDSRFARHALDAFIGPGHVSTVIGCRPYEWIAQNEGKPIVVSGFEPLDMLQSIVMLLRQLKRGRSQGRKSIQARRPVGRQSRRSKSHGRGLRVASLLRVARPGLHLAIGAAHSRQVRRMGRRAALRSSRHSRDRSQSRAMRRSAEGRAEAASVQTCLAASARRSIRSARSWFHRKDHAPPITTTNTARPQW